MGIYLPNMEMPKGADEHRLIIRANGQVIIDKKTYWEEAEAVPVPPHGRLIDAEAYKSLLRGLGDRNYRREKGTICDAIKFLHPYYAPTIIQASGKDTDVPTREECE